MPPIMHTLQAALLILTVSSCAFLLTTMVSTTPLTATPRSIVSSPPKPELIPEKRQLSLTDPNFVGWYNGLSGSYENINCGTDTWSTSSLWGACASSTSGNWPSSTACDDVTCGGVFSCGTLSIIQQSPWSGSTWYWLRCCDFNWMAWTMYREVAPSTTPSVLQSTKTNTRRATTASPSPTASVADPSSLLPTSGLSQSPSPHSSPSSNDQSWIAAAVIVPIVSITIACFIVWFLRWKHSHQQQGVTGGRDEGNQVNKNGEHGRETLAEASAVQPSYELSQAASVDRSRRTVELQG